MEIRLVLVFKDTSDLNIDMPAILESPYKTCEAHKLILVTMSGQNMVCQKIIETEKNTHTLSSMLTSRVAHCRASISPELS